MTLEYRFQIQIDDERNDARRRETGRHLLDEPDMDVPRSSELLEELRALRGRRGLLTRDGA